MIDREEPQNDLSALREGASPDVVGRAFRRFRRRLLIVGLTAAVCVAAVAFLAGRSTSDERKLEAAIGKDHSPFQLVTQELVGDEEWKVYAYRDEADRPCLVETLGGGGCYAYAGRVKGQIADYGVSGSASTDADGTELSYLVVAGAVPLSVKSVVVEFDDGALERADAHAFPGFDERMFAVLSEGSLDRQVVEVRAAGHS